MHLAREAQNPQCQAIQSRGLSVRPGALPTQSLQLGFQRLPVELVRLAFFSFLIGQGRLDFVQVVQTEQRTTVSQPQR